ncbi:Mg-protoporphyrin IX monomethyl ester oxidative cyclase (anaerobic) [Paramagnetospirillum magnetotacticum MS-1]|uniref:Mg-protoporphyrin IX monomethyl ester oxidative cyclase (Anaerobic) n=2 Tax=Paramagnetospirillum magnetotacticum TaxID=188 RepID=A0A0C2YWS8_PARME|nr:Mg-protoporphyrin IX monomethyl ester oxidative cyclase (anaerobic) [Paramagnetospirillum magnetotacticum MS-1]
MALVATAASKAFSVRAIDNNGLYRLYSHDDIAAEVEHFRPDVIGLSIITANALTSYETAEMLKRRFPDIPILAGGLHVSHQVGEALESGIDYVVRGEADLTIVPLLSALVEARDRGMPPDFTGIAGVSHGRGEAFVDGGNATLPLNLDEHSDVDFGLYDLGDFYRHPRDSLAIGSVLTQRGCPFRCTFCSDQYLSQSVRYRSIARSVDEIEDKLDRFGVNIFNIRDADFTMHNERVVEFCNELIRRGLHNRINLTIETDSFRVIPRDTLALMKQSGFSSIGFGIERLTPEIQRRIKKNISRSRIMENLKNCRELGFVISVHCLIGFSFDTMEDIAREQALFDELADQYVDIVSASIVVACPGTSEFSAVPPERSSWYLNPSAFPSRRPLYQVVRRFQYDPRHVPIYDFPPGMMERMMDFRDHFRKKTIGKRGRPLLWAYLLMLQIARLSEALYAASPRLERATFGWTLDWLETLNAIFTKLWAKRNDDRVNANHSCGQTPQP